MHKLAGSSSRSSSTTATLAGQPAHIANHGDCTRLSRRRPGLPGGERWSLRKLRSSVPEPEPMCRAVVCVAWHQASCADFHGRRPSFKSIRISLGLAPCACAFLTHVSVFQAHLYLQMSRLHVDGAETTHLDSPGIYIHTYMYASIRRPLLASRVWGQP